MHKLSAMYDDGLCIFACGQIATLSADERHPHLSTYAFSTPEARIPALMRGTGQISFRSIIGKTKHVNSSSSWSSQHCNIEGSSEPICLGLR